MVKYFSKYKIIISFLSVALLLPAAALAQTKAEDWPSIAHLKEGDSDNDGLNDYEEFYIYRTDPHNPDSDFDGYVDGDEVKNQYDPNLYQDDKLEKGIVVTLDDQSLSYKLGDYIINTFKISSGTRYHPSPKGDFSVLIKKPVVDYIGQDYSYPRTKWNLMFKYGGAGNYYIHGAYWHNNFGNPMSHGCINVAYINMEELYDWADVGTKITIK